MLRSVITMKKNIDINKYVHLIAFLKIKSEGSRPKKSKIITKDIAFCWKLTIEHELTNLHLQEVKHEGQCIHIIIPFTKTRIPRYYFSAQPSWLHLLSVQSICRVYCNRKILPVYVNNKVGDDWYIVDVCNPQV